MCERRKISTARCASGCIRASTQSKLATVIEQRKLQKNRETSYQRIGKEVRPGGLEWEMASFEVGGNIGNQDAHSTPLKRQQRDRT
jgi:hypothetical protein